MSANKPAAKPPTAPQKSWVSHKHARTHTNREFLTCCCVGLEVKLSLTLGWKFTAGRRKKKIVRIRVRKCCYINLMWARSILQHLWLQPTPLHSELCSRIRGRVEIGRAQILACKSTSRPGFLSCARPKQARWLWFINWQRAKHLLPPERWFIFVVIAQEFMCFLLYFKQMSKSKAKVIASTGQGWTSLWHWNIFAKKNIFQANVWFKNKKRSKNCVSPGQNGFRHNRLLPWILIRSSIVTFYMCLTFRILCFKYHYCK